VQCILLLLKNRYYYQQNQNKLKWSRNCLSRSVAETNQQKHNIGV